MLYKKVIVIIGITLLFFTALYTTVTIVDAATSTCTDHDGGIAEFITSFVDGVGPSGYNYTKYDVCIDDSNLKEMRCVSDVAQGYQVACEFGCIDGACIEGEPGEPTLTPIPSATPEPTEVPSPTPEPTPLPTVTPGDYKNTLIIGWDGTQRNHLLEIWDTLNSLPQFAFWEIDISSGATDTKAGWSQIVSGYTAEHTGIYSNGVYNPLPVGYSLFEKAEAHFSEVNTFFISGKSVHTGDACVGEETYCAGIPCIETQGQPYCYMSDNIDHYQFDLRWGDIVLETAKNYLLDHRDEFFVGMVIFREPDVCGHITNENDPYYTWCIQESDYHTGELIEYMKSIGIYDNTIIYITSDHGFDEGSSRHGDAPFVFLGTNNPSVIRPGDRMDLAPTILEYYGIPNDTDGLPLTTQ